jgi:uroporphyrinogen decarboxylase
MTGRERMLKMLRFEPTDRPCHFESTFELGDSAFGKNFPQVDWEKISGDEKARAIDQNLKIYDKIITRYEWDALAAWCPWCDPDMVGAAKKAFGDRILVGTMLGANCWGIDYISGFHDWMTFSEQLHERPHELHEHAEKLTQEAFELIDRLSDAEADFILFVDDVAANAGVFIRPHQFAEFVTPYLQRQIAHAEKRGIIPMWHSDGNLMSILDQILTFGAKMLHSIDPMAGMDIAEVKKLTYGKMAIMGNVQCSILQYGPMEKIRKSAEYCLTHGAPGGGYVFSNSNSIFGGIPLEHYEYMLEVFRQFCDAQEPTA